ncbi:hypothetical protein L1987_54582 [Smallanthus sonchifolius]|uniref:Uncharacterized protein n=1 Tax=Smallanthus sonchifolius TaxID=185202 RepID=A0ACB9E7V0_9ASTR|nr:hypothetical protein L1987_54582 [Smallanthus sonchifolius]
MTEEDDTDSLEAWIKEHEAFKRLLFQPAFDQLVARAVDEAFPEEIEIEEEEKETTVQILSVAAKAKKVAYPSLEDEEADSSRAAEERKSQILGMIRSRALTDDQKGKGEGEDIMETVVGEDEEKEDVPPLPTPQFANEANVEVSIETSTSAIVIYEAKAEASIKDKGKGIYD